MTGALPMGFSEFLNFIDSTATLHYNHPDHTSNQEQLLASSLRSVTDADLYRFDAWSSLATNLLDGSSLNSAANRFYGNGEFSDDSWWYHCNWVVSLGSSKFKTAIADPDSFYASFATERDFPISPSYDAGSFGYGQYLDEVQRRRLTDDVTLDLQDDLSEELSRVSKLNHSDFPKIDRQLSDHGREYFCSFEDPLLSAAVAHWQRTTD